MVSSLMPTSVSLPATPPAAAVPVTLMVWWMRTLPLSSR
jgi:hypothetical protein